MPYNKIIIYRLLLLAFFYLSFISVKSQDQIVNNGYCKIYYKNGVISSEGIMRNGKPDSYWKTYYPSGVLKSEGNRKNYLLDSCWIFYNMYGDTLEKINYLLGKKSGYSYTYNTDRNDKPEFLGNIRSKELYVNDKKEGISYYYYNDGSLMRITNFKDNKEDGFAYEFQNGRMITILRYNKGFIVERERINRFSEEGLKAGLWKEFYSDFKVKYETNYKNGFKDGLYKEFSENGNLIVTHKYNEDKLIDDIIDDDSVSIINKYDDDGNIIFSGSYKENRPLGIHRFFDTAGKVANSYLYNDSGVKIGEGIVTMNGSKEGNWNYFYGNGKVRAEGKFINNKESGKWNFYYKNSNIEQVGEYRNGLYVGIWRWYFENGNLRKEESYLNGKEEGESVEYDEAGNIIAKGEYLEGEKEGLWIYYNNDHFEEGSYVTGLRDGKWKYYYNDRQLKFEGNYIQGNPDGKHKYYYDNGVLKEEQVYSQGIKEKHWKKYDIEGNLIITISYENDKEVRINGEKIELANTQIKLLR